ncbi:MAG: Smr/MutS family protein [Desulfobacca sp.]|nr:Smr/MutS family protein [Desulfobacca sp.]
MGSPSDQPQGQDPPQVNRRTSGGLYRPFQGLGALVKSEQLSLTNKPSPPRLRGNLDDHLLFQEAMRQVRPLPRQGAYMVPSHPRPRSLLPWPDEDWEALTQLHELVAGQRDFDLSFTDEYMEGQVASLDPRIMAALRAGAFPIQDYLDFHGLTVAAAREGLEKFLAQCQARGYRTVLIVHGRGHRSPNQIPVLKKHLQSWLTSKRFRRQVLAFATARPYDGGAGALYLLLRRYKPS